MRSLVLVLGDQLNLDATAFDGFDASLDAVWMAELAHESVHVWSGKPRIAMFLAAMRHFAHTLQAAGRTLHYTRLEAAVPGGRLDAQLQADIERLRPTRLVVTTPGEWRVLQSIKAVARADADERAFWERTIQKGKQQDGDLGEALRLIARHGTMEATRADALAWSEKAKTAMRRLPEHDLRETLIDLADYVVARIS